MSAYPSPAHNLRRCSIGRDILWGDVAQWLHPNELEAYDVITFGKNNDANRLFLRGQFSLHK
jgi:8-oxo-dGTP pyrophosphatase MutT (NUDIX family)